MVDHATLCAADSPSCDIAKLAAEVVALRERLDAMGVGAPLRWLVGHAADLLLLIGVVGLVVALVVWLSRGAPFLPLKSASLSPTGASFTFEQVAMQQIGAFLSSVQDHAVRDAADLRLRGLVRALRDGEGTKAPAGLFALADRIEAGLPDAAPPENFATPPPGTMPPPKPLSVLWIAPSEEASRFARMVVAKMGNRVDHVTGGAAALMRIESGTAYDLVVTDATGSTDGTAGGLDVALRLIDGVGPFHLGPRLRLAIVAGGDAARRATAQTTAAISRIEPARRKPALDNLLVTDDFYILRGRIAWLQKQT